ncbi:SUMF1/EgtB/PvdO family nonheme iron enzyme [bacterium]|nr:SUMF1/EgtB/PvdO family nonheme iron enzyme [bacterium]
MKCQTKKYGQLCNIDGSKANYLNSGDPWDNGTTPCGYYDGNQIPAGTDMANGYGLYDMAENVWEWNNDRYLGNWYSQAGATNANTRGPTSVSDRVIRGGGWPYDAHLARCAYRFNSASGNGWYFIGFRCVRF